MQKNNNNTTTAQSVQLSCTAPCVDNCSAEYIEMPLRLAVRGIGLKEKATICIHTEVQNFIS